MEVDAVDEDLQRTHAHAFGFLTEPAGLGETGRREGAHHFGEELGEAGFFKGWAEHFVEDCGLGPQQFGGPGGGCVTQDVEPAVGVERQSPDSDFPPQWRGVDLTAQREGRVRVDLQATGNHVEAGRAAARLLENGAFGAGLNLGELAELAPEYREARPCADLFLDGETAAESEGVAPEASG